MNKPNDEHIQELLDQKNEAPMPYTSEAAQAYQLLYQLLDAPSSDKVNDVKPQKLYKVIHRTNFKEAWIDYTVLILSIIVLISIALAVNLIV